MTKHVLPGFYMFSFVLSDSINFAIRGEQYFSRISYFRYLHHAKWLTKVRLGMNCKSHF